MRAKLVLTTTIALLSVGCQGGIGDGSPRPRNRMSTPGNNGGTTGVTGNPASPCQSLAAGLHGPSPLQRLSRAEFTQLTNDLLNDKRSVGQGLPIDDDSGDLGSGARSLIVTSDWLNQARWNFRRHRNALGQLGDRLDQRAGLVEHPLPAQYPVDPRRQRGWLLPYRPLAPIHARPTTQQSAGLVHERHGVDRRADLRRSRFLHWSAERPRCLILAMKTGSRTGRELTEALLSDLRSGETGACTRCSPGGPGPAGDQLNGWTYRQIGRQLTRPGCIEAARRVASCHALSWSRGAGITRTLRSQGTHEVQHA